mmetsp:Transcript_56025/g.120601  ORF Transcript_56025/g.120601 Transcript_56025/m.120601 type:complete len:286 (-) Transcript_56025:300-1157(-)
MTSPESASSGPKCEASSVVGLGICINAGLAISALEVHVETTTACACTSTDILFDAAAVGDEACDSTGDIASLIRPCVVSAVDGVDGDNAIVPAIAHSGAVGGVRPTGGSASICPSFCCTSAGSTGVREEAFPGDVNGLLAKADGRTLASGKGLGGGAGTSSGTGACGCEGDKWPGKLRPSRVGKGSSSNVGRGRASGAGGAVAAKAGGASSPLRSSARTPSRSCAASCARSARRWRTRARASRRRPQDSATSASGGGIRRLSTSSSPSPAGAEFPRQSAVPPSSG